MRKSWISVRRAIRLITRVLGTIRRTDSQLLRMLTAQVLVIIIATLPYCLYLLYASFTSGFTKSALKIAQDTLAAQITAIVTYFAHSSSFYLYTLSGTIFRKEVVKILGQCRHPCRDRVHPMDGSQHQISVLQTARPITTTNNAPK